MCVSVPRSALADELEAYEYRPFAHHNGIMHPCCFEGRKAVQPARPRTLLSTLGQHGKPGATKYSSSCVMSKLL